MHRKMQQRQEHCIGVPAFAVFRMEKGVKPFPGGSGAPASRPVSCPSSPARSAAWRRGCRRSPGNRSLPSCWSPVGSANNAFPLYSGRFSLTCPRTVLTRLHVYGSPSVTSSYLTHLWIFALHSAHTTKVFLYI